MNLLELAAEDEMKAKLLFASNPPTHDQIVGDFWEQDVWQPLCPDLSAPSIVHQMFFSSGESSLWTVSTKQHCWNNIEKCYRFVPQCVVLYAVAYANVWLEIFAKDFLAFIVVTFHGNFHLFDSCVCLLHGLHVLHILSCIDHVVVILSNCCIPVVWAERKSQTCLPDL